MLIKCNQEDVDLIDLHLKKINIIIEFITNLCLIIQGDKQKTA